ncbi:hypothetical protein PC116_g13127 [Phytophthora cactorum]|nr:hypothetical protein PC116_g13127 [Phytophthora cactorum]
MKCACPTARVKSLRQLIPVSSAAMVFSDDQYDGRMSARFCSASCLYQWKPVTSPPPVPA